MGSVERKRGWVWRVKACRGWLWLLFILPGTGLAQPPIDINKATREELQRLPAIGPTLADRIIAHRARHGPFRRAQEIVAVRGLSARRYRQIATLITASR